MSTSCIEQVALEFVGGGSDKLYVAQVQEIVGSGGTQYVTKGFYGRRGAGLSETEKYRGASSASAVAAFNKLVKEKTGKGYSNMAVSAGVPIRGMPSDAPVYGGASTPGSAAPALATVAAVGPSPMLAMALESEALFEAYLDNEDAVLQRKYDGERVIVSLRRSAIVATNRKGFVRPLTAGAEAELKKLLAQTDFSDERETVLDGELMGEEYIAYDVLTLRDNDMRGLPNDERAASLEALLDSNLGLLAPTAWTRAEKLALYREALAKGWEGVMVRLGGAPYQAGRSKNLMKYKLWATCTCRVLTANSGRRSIQVALRDEDDNDVGVGNVTVPVNQDIPEAYSLVEVRYLYAMEGGSLYQPTLIRPRDDIDECDLRSSLRAAPPEKRKDAEAATSEATAESADAS